MARLRCEPTRGSAAWQAYSFRPTDPVWAPRELIERTRKALKSYDSYLDVWWSPMRRFESELPGRWRIVCYMPNTSTWDTVLYWEGDGGEYRHLSPEGCLLAAQRCDLWARGSDLGQLSKKLDDKRHAAEDKAQATKFDDVWRDSIQYADAKTKKIQHFDMAHRE